LYYVKKPEIPPGLFSIPKSPFFSKKTVHPEMNVLYFSRFFPDEFERNVFLRQGSKGMDDFGQSNTFETSRSPRTLAIPGTRLHAPRRFTPLAGAASQDGMLRQEGASELM
jgi:hypothetical protein